MEREANVQIGFHSLKTRLLAQNSTIFKSIEGGYLLIGLISRLK